MKKILRDRAIKFYDKMSNLEYIAGGSTNIGAGTTRPALSNCFLLEIQDDIENIAKSVSDVIKISKATGGIGASITKLRASGSPPIFKQHNFFWPYSFRKNYRHGNKGYTKRREEKRSFVLLYGKLAH